MIDLWEYLVNTKKPIVLYGLGNGGDKIIDYLESKGGKVSGVFSGRSYTRPKTFRGMPVTDFKTAKESFGDMIVLVCFGTALPDVIGEIKAVAAECELYVPDVPVYGDNLFDSDFCKAHSKEIEWVYNRLYDDTSRLVFENCIRFKLSGKADYLYNCESSVQDVYDLIGLKNDESYLDLGAYNGDTIELFLKNTENYNNIIALEPDSRSYKKLCENTYGLEKITCINACVGEQDGTVLFNTGRGRGSALKGVGVQTACRSIDSLVNKNGVSFIKFDVEGNEADAINGGKNTILKYKPKMLIAAYHRSEDIFAIPKQICSIRDDYKILLRHNPCLPCWDTNYIFI